MRESGSTRRTQRLRVIARDRDRDDTIAGAAATAATAADTKRGVG